MTTPEHNEDEHPAVESLRRDVTIGQGARQGAAWIGGSRVAVQVFQFAVSVVTARLLLPEQFGEAAIVISVSVFARLFTELGLAASIVQAKRVTEELLSTAFWLNLVSGIGLTALVCALSVPLAAFYDQPSLVPLLLLASANFVLSVGVVQTGLLERTFNFRQVAMIESISNIVGLAAMPVAAALGAGTYSLVLGPLVTTIMSTIWLWIYVKWRPASRPTKSAVVELWRFSRGLVGFNAVNYWSRNLDNLLLGKVASLNSLGLYTRAYSVTSVPVQQMSMVVARVLFPSLARMQDEPKRLARAWGRGIAAAGSLTMPIAVTLAVTAPALVAVLYGPRWAGMVPILQVLALAAMPQIVATATGSIYRATGTTDTLFWLGLANTGMSVVAIVAGLPWGAVGVATALLVRSWLSLPVAFYPLTRILGVSMWSLLRPTVGIVWPTAALAAGAALPLWVAPLDSDAPTMLLLQLAAGGVAYGLTLWRTEPVLVRDLSTRARGLWRRRSART